MNDCPKRIYFQLPEERVDCKRLKMVCLQLSDGTEMWFETSKTYTALMDKLAKALKRAERVEAQIAAIKELDRHNVRVAKDSLQRVFVVIASSIDAALE